MDTIAVIREAGEQLKTLTFDYTEKDGSNEGTREVEPYSFRPAGTTDLFFGFDINKNEIRSFKPSTIHNIRITDNNYTPRNGWDVEV